MFNIFFKYILILILFIFLSKVSIAITGKDISEKISSWLILEGVEGEPIFSKTSVFKDCDSDIEINKIYKNFKTVNIRCLDKNGFNLFVRVKPNKIYNFTKNKKKLHQINLLNGTKKSIEKNNKNKDFNIVKLSKALEKNSIIKSEDLDVIIATKSSEKSFFSSKKLLIGRKLKKNLKMGQLLHPRHLYEKFEIHSGDSLSIVSRMGNAAVTVAGEAQSSGNLGDLIKVKNLRSGKIIKGYIKKNKIIRVFR